MSANTFKELRQHIGHKIVCVGYNKVSVKRNLKLINVAIECETCHEVLIDFDGKIEVQKSD